MSGASSGGIKAGKAFVLIEAVDKTGAMLNKIGTNLQSWGTKLIGIGTGILGPLTAAVFKFTEMGGKLADMSGRTGLPVEEISELDFAARQTGASLEDVENSLRFAQKSGNRKSLDQLAEHFAGIQDPVKRTQEAIKLFGKSGTKLLPMLANLKDLRQEARRLGLVKTTAQVNRADELGDTWDKVKDTIESAIFQIGDAVAPVFQTIFEQVLAVTGGFNHWIQKNKGLVVAVFAVGAAIAGLGVALVTIGTLFTAGATVLGALTSLFAFFLSPLGLVVAGVLALVAALIYFRNEIPGVNAVLGRLIEMGGTIKDTFKGIVDALSVGDIQAAWDIGVAGIQTTWSQVVDGLMDTWDSFSSFFVEAWYGAMGEFKAAWTSAQKTIANGILDLAEQEGILGDLMDMVLGVDVSAEKARAAKLGNLQAFHDTGRGAMNKDFDSGINAAREEAGKRLEERRQKLDEANAKREAEIQKRRKDLQDKLDRVAAKVEEKRLADQEAPPVVAEELEGPKSAILKANDGIEDSFQAAKQAYENAQREMMTPEDKEIPRKSLEELEGIHDQLEQLNGNLAVV